MGKKKDIGGNDYRYLPIQIIIEATQNDELALEYILKRYQSYIEKLASHKVRDRNRRWFTVLDEDKKQQIEEVLILAIRQFKIE